MNTHTRLSLAGLIVMVGLTLLPQLALAHTVANEPPGFDPELLITDAAFLSSSTMNGDQINAFLASKGSWLANYILPEYMDVPYFCRTAGGANEIRTTSSVRQIHVNGTPLYGMRAADLLAERAIVNGLNPQVMLALLERESSAITRAAPTSQMTRAWPLFYNFDETMAQYGYSCTHAEDIARNFGGVGLQIGYGTFGVKNRYNNNCGHNPSGATISGVFIQFKSRATYALYCYTPNIHPGNHNFWYLFKSWFAPWQATLVSQSAYPTLTNGQSAQFEVRLQNTGSTIWQQESLFLGTSGPRDRVSVFTRGDGWVNEHRVQLLESTVAPGATGTFRFSLSVPQNLTPGTYREYFQPVAETITWLPDIGLYWDITVLPLAQTYHSAWVSQNANPTLAPGASYQFELRARNTGISAWQQDTVFLGTSEPHNRLPVFTTADTPGNNPSGWTNPRRVMLAEPSVAPNEIGTFRFWYTVPDTLAAGTHREHFQPVAEQITWLEDEGIYWDITILPDYHSHWVAQNTHPTLLPDQSYQFEMRLTNTGNIAWTPSTVFLGTSWLKDRQTVFTQGAGWASATRARLVEAFVAPGATGTFRLSLTVPTSLAPGVYREYFQAVTDTNTWLEDEGMYWDITVLPADAYRSTWVSQNGYPTLTYGQSYEFEVRLRNIGSRTWTPDIVELATNEPLDRTSSLTRGAGWTSSSRVTLVESSVAPGGIGTFRFAYRVPQGLPTQTYREYFRPVARTITPMEDQGIFWDITVVPPAVAYRSAWVSQNSYPTLRAGDSYEFETRIQNAGAITWTQETVFLGSSWPQNRVIAFQQGAGWATDNRVRLVETSVAPGATGTFRFTLTVPTGLAPGLYREYFQPVAEHITWMEDQGIHWNIQVVSLANSYHSQWVSQNSYPTLQPGQSYQFEVRLKNTGVSTWSSPAVALATANPINRLPIFQRTSGDGSPSGWIKENRIHLVEESVAPGATGTFRFWYTVPLGIQPGTYREYFRPLAEGIALMEDHGLYWDITVSP